MSLYDNLRETESVIPYIMEEYSLDVDSAKKKIRGMTFLEYNKVLEASVDKSTQHQTDQQQSFTSNIKTASDQQNGSDQPNEPPKSGDKVSLQDVEGELEVISANDRETKLRGADGKEITTPTDQVVMPDDRFGNSGMASRFKSAFNKGYQSQFGEDLDRLRKLSGITETTTAGNVAATPSIVGDTSDSHKPSVQLRKRLRLEKEADEKRERKIKKKAETERRRKQD